MSRVFLLCLLTIFYLSFSCGLKYEPKELPIEFLERRQSALKAHLLQEFAKTNQSYSPITFGKSKTIKPISHQKLDSLYEVKYKLEEANESTELLNEPIAMQRLIAVNDTNTVLYIEDHVFSILNGDTAEIYFGLFQLNPDLEVMDYELKESVFIPKNLLNSYKTYLFEESFLNPGYFPTVQEQDFYNLYKNHLSDIPASQKDQFIEHTLHVMQMAQNKGTLNTIPLLKEIIIQHLHADSFSQAKHIFPSIDEYTDTVDGKKMVVGYYVQYTYESKKETDPPAKVHELELNKYLEIISESSF
jgi:hypothetical protein